MSAYRKYAFDTEFSPEGAVRQARAPTQADLDAARAAGLAEGRALAAAEHERLTTDALAVIARQLTAIAGTLTAETAQLRAEAVELAWAAAQTLAGEALAQFGEERIAAAFAAALDGALREAPRIVVRAPEAQFTALKTRLEGIAADHGHAGALVVRPDGRLGPGDVTLEWADGAMAISRAEAHARIEAAIAEALGQSAPAPARPAGAATP